MAKTTYKVTMIVINQDAWITNYTEKVDAESEFLAQKKALERMRKRFPKDNVFIVKEEYK
ncbi:MAG: hypothetical protein LBF22_07765 [Deltaproteobacteria bacterium]|jgi:hypothetical protein|nr:hypothetical protein [Deltaproteobacteria bacterium]